MLFFDSFTPLTCQFPLPLEMFVGGWTLRLIVWQRRVALIYSSFLFLFLPLSWLPFLSLCPFSRYFLHLLLKTVSTAASMCFYLRRRNWASPCSFMSFSTLFSFSDLCLLALTPFNFIFCFSGCFLCTPSVLFISFSLPWVFFFVRHTF